MDFEKFNVKYRLVIFLIFILITVFLGFFLKNLRFDSDILKLIPKTKETEELRKNNKNNYLLATIIMFQDKNNIFKKENFEKMDEAIKDVTKILKVSDSSVTSLFSYFPQFKKDIYTDEDMEVMKKKVNDTTFVKKTFLNDDGNLTYAVIVPSESDKVNFDRSLKTELEAMEAAIKKYETDDFKLYISGDLVVREKILNYMLDDFKILGPLATFVVILSLYLVVGNLLGALIPVLVAIFALIWTFGLKGLVNSPITVPETPMIVLLISIGCANAVHIMNGILKEIRTEPLSKELIIRTMKRLKTPILLTSLTTAFGFLSLISSSINAYKAMGIFMAIGVIFAMLISLIVLPGILVKIPFKVKETNQNKNSFLGSLALLNKKFTEIILNRKYISLSIIIIVFGISIVGLLRVEINFNETDYFKDSTSVKKTLNLMQKEIGGISVFKINIKGSPGEFKEIEKMRGLDLVTDKLDDYSPKTQSSSINGIIRFMNFKIKKERPEEYRLPENPLILNQLIVLISRSTSMRKMKSSYINDDWSEISIIVRIENSSTEGITAFAEYAKKTIDEYLPNYDITFSGAYDKILISKTMVKEQIINIVTTLVAISLLLMVFFKSLRMGIIISIPVAWSVFLNFAVMRLFGITLNPATATIASVSMGVGVDYSIHFFSAFILQYKKEQDYKKALLDSIPNVFNGIFANSISVGIGFLTLIFSTYKIIATLGAIIAFTMLTTSFASLTVLPLLIYLFKPSINHIKIKKEEIEEH